MRKHLRPWVSQIALVGSGCVLISIVAGVFGDFFVSIVGLQTSSGQYKYLHFLGTAFGFSFLSGLYVGCLLIPAELSGISRILRRKSISEEADRQISRSALLLGAMIFAFGSAVSAALAVNFMATIGRT